MEAKKVTTEVITMSLGFDEIGLEGEGWRLTEASHANDGVLRLVIERKTESKGAGHGGVH